LEIKVLLCAVAVESSESQVCSEDVTIVVADGDGRL